MKLKIHFNHKEELGTPGLMPEASCWVSSWASSSSIGVSRSTMVGPQRASSSIFSVCSCHTSLPPPIMPFLPGASGKERLRKWDHAAIYWHIAGSYSPITLIAMREQGYWGWSLFIFIRACAIAGTIMSFAKLKDHSNLETLCFVGMGLSVLVALQASYRFCFPSHSPVDYCRSVFATSRVLYFTVSTRRNTCIPCSISLYWQVVSATSSPFGTSS